MTQDSIFDWLLEKRKGGDNSFFSIREIRAGIQGTYKVPGIRVYEQCLQLYRFNILEIRREGMIISGYRVRKKYVSNEGGD